MTVNIQEYQEAMEFNGFASVLLMTIYLAKMQFSLKLRDQASHPYKSTGKITVLYSLVFVFLDSKLEVKIFCT